MGDMNSLARSDGYDDSIISGFNEMQIKKFTENGKLCFDVTDLISENGFADPAVELKLNKVHTAPTSINEKSAHSDMRLDYIYVSQPLKPRILSYRVIKNEVTEAASDHYPVVLELGVHIFEK